MPDETTLSMRIERAARFVSSTLDGFQPEVGIILGSGLNALADCVENARVLPYEQVPSMGTSSCMGHVGRFVAGTLAGKRVLCMQGRLHGYEGYSSQEVAFPVWVMHALGAQTLITTNAAGAINKSYQVGDFCIMRDHINFTGRNPVQGMEPNEVAFRFFSMKDCYDPALRELAQTVANEQGIPAHQGVYLGLLGPSFETAAEIRAFRMWGADTVAMSVVEEVIAARHVGMRVLGISLCSNMACDDEEELPDHEDILEQAAGRADDFERLVTGIVAAL